MDSATRLQTILVDSPVGVVLPAIALLNLPDWWLAGGAVRNTVWRSLGCVFKLYGLRLSRWSSP